MSHPPSKPVAYFCLGLSMTMVGCYVALTKPLVATIPVFLLAWLRFGIAAVAMAPWLRKTGVEVPMTRQTRGLLFLESFFGNFLFTLCMITGVSLTSAVSAGVIMAAIPAAVAVFSWIFLKEKANARTWWAIALAVAGIALLALAPGHPGSHGTEADGNSQSTEGSRSLIGHLLLVAAVLCEASYAVIGKKLTAALPPKRITAIINLWGLALSTPMGIYMALQFDFAAVASGIWWLLLLYALAASMWTVWLWMTGLRTVPASQSGIFTVLLPVSAALTGVLLLGESLQPLQLLALGIALASVLVATVPVPRRAASVPAAK
ncbi:DMT family transporter [Comamonas terrigena]|uniref:DMT family transporter n=1 Tax=Comamonas terrigena TaxID=32013 RepID=UPI0028A9CF30|nr:DMT family transporter [Comamonas terrigena]